MADIIFPSSLPQTFMVAGLSVSERPNVVHQPMGVGTAKRRPADTVNELKVHGTLFMSREQLEIFETFYFDVLDYGVAKFLWRHPHLLAFEVTAYFDQSGGKPYTVVPVDTMGNNYQVALELLTSQIDLTCFILYMKPDLIMLPTLRML